MTDRRSLRTDASAALRALLEGNRRYAADSTDHPERSAERRVALTQGQEPFATIVGCADSRVPAEYVFDRGLGDLFVVRTAGHVVDEAVLASIEFGALELGTPLIFVLGHEGCGAVKAALSASEGAAVSDHAEPLIDAIMPAVERARSLAGDTLDNAVRANVALTLELLQRSEALLPALHTGSVKIVGGLYELDSGVVHLTAP